MTIGSILLGLALLGLVVMFIARPLLRPQLQEAALSEKQLLLNEKEALLDQIQALDFDHETGKIPSDLHALQREKLVEQAAVVLRALDMAGDQFASEVAATATPDIDNEIEAAVARLRRQTSQPSEADSLPVRNGHPRFCPQCGVPTDPGDKFCANCGHNLTLTTSTKTA